MQAAIFDPMTFIRKLEKVGVPREHADVFASEQAEAFNRLQAALNAKITNELATKGDIRQLESLIREAEAKNMANLEKLKNSILIWGLPVGLGVIAVLLTGFAIAMARLSTKLLITQGLCYACCNI